MADTKTFAERFGPDAFVHRPTAAGFDVFTRNNSDARPETRGLPVSYDATPPTKWQFDPKTLTYTNPVTKQTASIADLGIKDPVTASFEVGRLASSEGKNIDGWSSAAITGGSVRNPEHYRQWFQSQSPRIKEYEAKGSLLDKLLDYAPMAIMAVSGFGAALGNTLTASIGQLPASIVGGAASGALSSAASGGNIVKGALMGGAGGAIGNVTSYMEGGANFTGPVQDSILSTSNIASAVGSAGLAAATGGNAGAALVGSLAGSGVRNVTGSGAAGTIASKATGLLMSDDQSSAGGGGVTRQPGLIDSPAGTAGKAPGAINTQESQPTVTTPVSTTAAAPIDDGGMYGFGAAVPIGYQVVNRRDMNWGKRGV